jgi:pSer/pThr/pTyr-binding forkhead associated (FHA) protein
LQHQFCSPLGLGDLPFIVGRRPTAGEGLPPRQPDLELNDTAPFRLSRNHFAIEEHDGGYRVRDLCSTLGTIVNGEPIGQYVAADASTAWGHLASDAPLRAGENEVIAGGANSPFVFSVFITSSSGVDKNTDWQICIADRPQMAPRKVTDYRLPPGRSQFRNRINETNQLEQNRIVEANKLEAVKRLLMVLALSVLTGGCGIAVGQDVRAYDACLSRHPHDTVVCEGPRQAYELEPSVVQPRSVASRPAASYDH